MSKKTTFFSASMRRGLVLGSAAAILALSVFIGAPSSVEARGGASAPVKAKPASTAPRKPDYKLGAQYFDQAIAWVSAGRGRIPDVNNFYCDLEDVQMKVDAQHQEGFVRLWFQDPDKYRFEIRPRKPLRNTTTKILNGDKMWVVSSNGRVTRMHGKEGGAKAINQLRKDRTRLADLSKFVTLQGLKGPGVKFSFDGKKKGSSTFAGKWVQITREVPGGATIVFFFAHEEDQYGRIRRVNHPGIVTVVGRPERGEPTEYYLLQEWKQGPQFRYPGRIEAYTQARPGAQMKRFLLAFPNVIRVNAQLKPKTFSPPAARKSSSSNSATRKK